MQSRLTDESVTKMLATPTVVLWLCLVIVPARVATQCPAQCDCSVPRYGVICWRKSLTTVPFFNLTGVTNLMLIGNNITVIKKDSFVLQPGLEVIKILNSSVNEIELGAFNRLGNLTSLGLSYNRISKIIQGTFKNLNNLERLDLSNNRLHHLDSDVFSGLFELRSVLLYRNNLQHLHPDTFLGLPNIEFLCLAENPGLQIPTDRNFINSQKLSRLDIAGCNVSALSAETFANISALRWLDLRNNYLTTLDINILTALPKLSVLYLHGNPLNCDCQLQEVWRLCKDRIIETVRWEILPQCDTPSEVHSMCLGVLEKGECLEGDIQYSGDYRNTSYCYTDTTEENTYE